MQKPIIMIDADHTLYEITSRYESYLEMIKFISQKTSLDPETLMETYEELKEKYTLLNDPEKRRREHLLKEMGLSDEIINQALKVFWNSILNNLKKPKHIDEFLEWASKHYDIVVFSDEFYENLIKKISKAFPHYEQWFKAYITPELTNCMKPCENYYKAIETNLKRSLNEVVIVVGDSWDRDLRIAKEKFRLRVGLYLRSDIPLEEQPINKVDLAFNDYFKLKAFLEGIK